MRPPTARLPGAGGPAIWRRAEVPEGADAGLGLLDPAGVSRLGLVVAADGRSLLATRSSEGKPRLLLGESPEGAATLRLSADDGAFRAVLGVTPDCGGSLIFMDGTGRVRHFDSRVTVHNVRSYLG